MIKKEKNGLVYFQFPKLASIPSISHGLFTRTGGVSKGNYSGLNAGDSTGDDDGAVIQNRALVLESVGGERLVRIKQVHSTRVVHVADEKAGLKEPENLQVADAVVTDVKGFALMIQTADCQPVLLFDPKNEVAGNIHSGWKGSVGNIVGETVRFMKDSYGSIPRDIVAGIGPSLGPCCAEFINYKKEIPEKYWEYKNEDDHFDFWRVTADQLKAEGVPEENIDISGLCTKCNQDLFFSYRRDKITGRLANVICLI